MSTEDRLHRLMSMVGTAEVDPGSWSDFVAVAHRDRLRHRIVAASALVATIAIASLGTAAVLNMDRADLPIPPSDRNVVPVPIPEDVPTDCPTAPEFTEGPLGTVAFLGATELHVVDVATGEDSILVQGGEGFGEGFFAGEVQISPDGQWVSFGEGLVVPTAGGEVCAPLGEGVHSFEWAPDEGVVALNGGELLVGGVDESATGHSYGGHPFTSLALSPDGRWAAVAAIPPNARASDRPDESSEWSENLPGLWVIDLEASSDEVLKFSVHLGDLTGIEIAGWSPDGEWILFWNTYQDGASVNADGSPLRVIEVATGEVLTITDYMITARDQLTRCGDRLVFTDGFGRLMQDKKVIAAAGPPSWDKEVIGEQTGQSLTDPACDDSGTKLAAVSTRIDGEGAPALVRWNSTTSPSEVLPIGFGVLHPVLSNDGLVAVVEVISDRNATGQANELVKVQGEDTTPLGILGGQSSYPMVGGPSWDWHRP
ncbi:MAG: hypothetical protein GEU71_13990 [Actinobacteria bacterium]|nr:hypothetical protein [Actinomycetota bacterium]